MSPSSKSHANGCIWIILVGVITVVFFGLLELFFSLSPILCFLGALLLSFMVTTKILGNPTLKSLLGNGFALFAIVIILKVLFDFLGEWADTSSDTIAFSKNEQVKLTTMIEGSDTISVYRSNRIWKDNYGNSFSGNLTVRERDYYYLKDHVNRYKPKSTINFWGNLYDYLDRTDTPSLDLVIKAFEEIGREKQLNQMQFAEMVVSCVQDIPYSLVFQEKCRPSEDYDESIRNLLERCPECCIGNILYGVQNPVSFIQNLKGDCDTRTVLIYSILNYFEFDVAILNSDYYKHSIIGINLPSSGLTKIYNGKKYALWETTAQYFELGYLSPNFNDIRYWNIVLTSK